ncbi:yersiniabactin nonribosomal peptide synthetase [Ruminiclostridium sufflavum DSM 19573]|uniref:Yersiniabactin nonribosomal peptide synthetase n=1 Tax=Ruminiclostridium sufflavum DSM 19573 TaxID=1121337 RepID=A0A318XRG7_9FIRM|nr:condensation domain-containing protein [Ruminiclostridium sufflavum]PYG90249.1 yersiniabactin nonribosomal peptide synthetase [Ruminiclostridium sufflavum DSM 19573]
MESRLEAYRSQGIQLWLEGEKLKFRGQKERLSEDILNELRQNKEEIIAYLKNRRYELTSIQHAYFAGSTAECELGNIHAQYYVEYRHKNIDTCRLEQAVNEVVRNNGALRTVIDSQGYQKELSDVPQVTIPVSRGRDTKELEEVRGYWRNYRYRYGEWPMINFQVTGLEEGEDILHVSFDCIILDAWSAKMMLDQIFLRYSGKEVSYPRISFRRYLELSRVYEKDNKNIAAAMEYWQGKAEKMPERPVLKLEKGFSEIDIPHFERLDYKFSKEETELLYLKVKSFNFTPAAVICTAFARILRRYSVNRAFTLNLTLFNRNPVHEDIERVLGDFTNIGFASFWGEPEKAFKEEIRDTQKQLWRLIQYRMYDGTKILRNPGRSMAGKAVMPVVFTGVLQGALKNEEKEFKESFAISQTPQVMLDHQARDDEGFLHLSWDYVREALGDKYIEEIFSDYITYIKALIYGEWDV